MRWMVNNKLVLSLVWFQASKGSPGLVLLSLAAMCSHASCSMVMSPLDWSQFPPLSRVWCDFHNMQAWLARYTYILTYPAPYRCSSEPETDLRSCLYLLGLCDGKQRALFPHFHYSNYERKCLTIHVTLHIIFYYE